jgi:hypothetical protein
LLSGALAFVGAGTLTLVRTGAGAHARTWHHAVFGVLAAFAVWQAFKLLLARALPRPPERHGFLERQVGRVRRRAEKRALVKARRRQRSLLLRVTGPDLRDWKQAKELAAAHPGSKLLRLTPGPDRLRLQDQDVAVHIVPAHGYERPLLRTTARPSDDYLAQDLSMMRALAGTIRWLGDQLPSGYNLEIRWASRTRKAWTVFRYLSRNLFGLLAGTATSQFGLERMPARSVMEVAAAARRGGLRMRCVHIVAQPRVKPVAAAEGVRTSAR